MIALGVTSCSYITMNDPPRQPTAPPACTATRVVPASDLVLGAAAVVATLGFVLAMLDEAGPGSVTAIGAGVGGGVATGFFASSSVGFGRARRCGEAKAAWRATRAPAAP